MLKNVSRHYSSCVRNTSHFFQVFLNNEKLPFILELFSNNQMYLSIINAIYSVSPNKSFFFCLNMVFPFLCNRQSPFTSQGYLQSEVYIYSLSMILSHTNDATKNFSLRTVLNHVLCKKSNKKHSNALKLKCAPGSNSKVSCQFWRKVSKSLCLKQGVWGMLSAQPCVSFLMSLIFSCVGEGTGHLPVGAHQIDLLFGMPNSVV